MKKTILKLLPIFTLLLLLTNSYAQDFEVSPAIMNFDVEPGQTQTIPINIINHSNKKQTFTLLLGDYVTNKVGTLIQMPEGSTEHSLANWININPPYFEMQPNEARQVIASVQAPVGDYSTRWVFIYVRTANEQTASVADKKLNTGLMVNTQIVINVIQSPKSNVNYRMKLTGLSEITTNSDTLRRFKAVADNLGDKIAKCRVTLLASSLSTAKEVKLQVVKFKSYPDAQREVILQMAKDALPPGKYALAAILDYGKQSNLEGTQMLITVD